MNTNIKTSILVLLALVAGFFIYRANSEKLVTTTNTESVSNNYTNPEMKFSIHVPQNYKIEELNSITKFTIPLSVATGTNLSTDSYLSVEEPAQTSDCKASSSTDAAAGNRYEVTTYVVPGSNPCLIVRYFIHYGVIQNYPIGAVKEFNKQALMAEFDSIRGTLKLAQ